jgi:hypothetical protein
LVRSSILPFRTYCAMITNFFMMGAVYGCRNESRHPG